MRIAIVSPLFESVPPRLYGGTERVVSYLTEELHPQLPEYLARVQIRNLRLGDAVVDLSLERHHRDVGVNVLNKAGEVEVSVVL